VNDEKAVDVDVSQVRYDKGHFALQVGTADTVAQFRKIEIKELPPTPLAPEPALARAPFNAEQAKVYQAAWSKHLGVPAEYENTIGMKFRLIPPGTGEVDKHGKLENPFPFFLGSHEVTVGQFRRFVEETKHKTTAETSKLGGASLIKAAGTTEARKPEYLWNHPDFAPGDDYPVTQITWRDAVAFCAWLSTKEGREYRLPTNTEWRWAAKAGSGATYYFGNNEPDQLDNHAWHGNNSQGHSHPVGKKEPNPWGLFDMYGNVWEISRDWYRDNKTIDLPAAPLGPQEGDKNIILGGSFRDAPSFVLGRGWSDTNFAYPHFGFRVALVGDLKPKPRTDK
jgi:formylglycine-generating enzyme required for sulfatase activity